MDAQPVAGPSNSSPPPPLPWQQRRASAISADAVSPRRSSRYLYNASSSPPSTPPPIRRRAKKKRDRERDRDKRPLRSSVSEHAIGKRHSHGLSWSSTTRDSVVDNLLFSLDNLSKSVVAGGDDDSPDLGFDKAKYMFPDIPPPLPTTRTARRARGHTQSSSLSTDYELSAMPDTPPKMSFSMKGRRSNSSSKYRPTSTINSRVSISKPSMDSSASIDTQKAPPNIPIPNGGAIKRQSSERGRPDINFDTLADKTKNRLKRRSMSVDHIFTDAIMSPGGSILDRGRPIPSALSKYDAGYEVAPEPLVAGGPRRKDNPTATGPVFVNQAQQRSSLRKITTQTDLRSANAMGPLSPGIPAEVRNQASNFVRMSSMQSRPTTQAHSKGQPNPSKQATQATTAQKDRPGFFRRMFGGSSSRATVVQPTGTHTPDSADPPASAVRGSTSTSSQGMTGLRQSSREGENAVPPPLNKKPSSLFRRRRKSLSEAPPPPPLPAAFTGLKIANVDPGPLNESFRQAMDPYLTEDEKVVNGPTSEKSGDPSRPSTSASVTEDSDNLDMFHPGYAQKSDIPLSSRGLASQSSSTKVEHRTEQEISPTGKMKVKKRKPDQLAPMDTSFLLDPSSREFSATPTASSEHVSPVADVAAKESALARPASKTSIGDKYLSAGGVSPIEASWEAHEKALSSPASKASSGDRNLSSSINGSEGRWDTRKPSVVSTVSSSGRGDDTWVRPNTQDRPLSKKSERLVLKPSVEEMLFYRSQGEVPVLPGLQRTQPESRKSSTYQTATSPALPPSIHSPMSPHSQYHSASSLPLPVEDSEAAKISPQLVDEGAEFRERARKIFEGDEEDVMKSEAAAWLGETNTLSTRTLAAYLQLFDFAGTTILAALRLLCGKLTLRGETQQFDRIITTLSARWCECNPHHGFKAQDVVHTICYSLILLNTDLHLADIEGKMSRSGYVKNTMPTIRNVVADAAPNAFDDTIRPNPTATRPTLPWSSSNTSVPQTPATPNMPIGERPSLDQERPATQKRQSLRPAMSRQESDSADAAASAGGGSNALVNQPWTGSMRAWESEIETVLKSFFLAIKIDPLPLHGAAGQDTSAAEQRNLSAPNLSSLRRSNSVISKTASDTASFRSKPGLRSVTSGLQNKYSLSRTKLYPPSTLNSSKTSFDDNSSVWSPAQSTWSKYSISKTLTSASMQSLGQHFAPSADFKHSIGFANALSQAIIREEQAGIDDSGSISVSGGMLDDEALTLEGAPWAKEGLVKHKHHLETPGKKAKERNWTDCFAVISKGKLTLFAFNTSTKSASMGRKTLTKNQGPNGRAASVGGQKVGGGDWMENAEQLESFILRQTIASTLPPPGYSKNRPHVWALNLPSGAVHLFQVGTLAIAKEFMSTANYWSARLSKEPLSGGVSNVEYGWSDAVINAALVERPISPPPPLSAGNNAPLVSMQNRQPGSHHKHSTSAGTMSMQSMTSSLRNSLDTGFGSKPRLPGDKAHLADWQPPTQSMMASQLMEVDQLKALTAYVGNVETELARHNELKGAIELAFSPRHANYTRAMANWQRKSEHLLRENVKFQTYVDSLTVAQKAREKFYAKRNGLEDAAPAVETDVVANSSVDGGDVGGRDSPLPAAAGV